jgi:hypothetical protein
MARRKKRQLRDKSLAYRAGRYLGTFRRKRRETREEERGRRYNEASGLAYRVTLDRIIGDVSREEFAKHTAALRHYLERVYKDDGPDAYRLAQKKAAEGAAEARQDVRDVKAGRSMNYMIRDRLGLLGTRVDRYGRY